MSMGPIWLIGCGNMAGAVLHRWLDRGLDPASVTVIRPSGADVAPGVRVLRKVPSGPSPDLLLLGIKPQMLAAVAPQLHAATQNTVLLSILAGVTLARLRENFPAARAIVRAMPNLPVALGKGVVATATDGAISPDLSKLLDQLGFVEAFTDEAQFDAVTALAGSGPAFAYRFVDALAKGGAALGLGAAQADRLALATVEGAIALARADGATLAALVDRVASKGGSTRAGLNVLDTRLDALMAETLAAATARNRSLESG